MLREYFTILEKKLYGRPGDLEKKDGKAIPRILKRVLTRVFGVVSEITWTDTKLR